MTSRQASNWISLSDMMTGLMLIFLLIAILAIIQVQNQEKERKLIAEKREEIIDAYNLSKEEIYLDLEKAFGDKREVWGIEISEDLSIKFLNPDLLFDTDDYELKENYKEILDEFIPLYLAILNKSEYSQNIKEVRIEGHTADVSEAYPTYIDTIFLSQSRSNSVLKYILENNYFMSLDKQNQNKLIFWFTSNGLGKGRTVDKEGEYTYLSKNTISPNSRRVEFRIVTNSEELIEEIISKNNN